MRKIFNSVLGLLACFSISCQAQNLLENDFSSSAEKLNCVGRGVCQVSNGVLSSKGSFALFGNKVWTNYSMSFKARAPKEAEQVQIWAGFHTYNRFDRYVVGIKGGLQDDLYLMRTGYMGMDELMGVRPLGFHPVPGEWYSLRIEVCGNRIRVFVNDNKLPHIDLVDKHMPQQAPSGEVALGGSWIKTEFDDLKVVELDKDALKSIPRKEFQKQLTVREKETIRKQARANYKGVKVTELTTDRTEIDLDGDWLFMPSYQMNDATQATAITTNDDNWHIMQVPNFWTPIRIWLHGESMSSPTGPQSKGVSDTYYQQESDRCENYTFEYRRTRAAWYRQWIELPEGVKGKQLTLSFDAVSKMAEVYINGQKAGSHIGMFSNFDIDATPYMKPGKNLVAIKVTRNIEGMSEQTSDAMENYYSSVRKEVEDNKNDKQANKHVITDVPHGFYGDNPAGIWQPVKLVITNPVKIADVFIQPSTTGAVFEVTVKNSASKKSTFTIFTDIIDKKTGKTLCSKALTNVVSLKGNEQKVYKCNVNGLQPKLWEPATPHLYDFKFSLKDPKGVATDLLTITSGFRTFESKDGFLYLNGRKYWLRGGNHIPFALCPNDAKLADKFMQLMREGNINSTRTHTTPWNKLWIEAADRNGIAVSFEGTWPWLMIHSTPIPDKTTMDLWRGEWLQLVKKYRNHPSVIFWTVNNEMKFYDLDADLERAKQKFSIISDVVKDMRKVDPTRPICFDSNYLNSKAVRRFGKEFVDTMDDGDIDDNHAYYNWYDFSVFRFFNGEFQKHFKAPGRPLISQEMSTGYPNNETGHPTRSYQLIHQNPFSLIGYEAYDWADPASFLKVQSFITGELAETLRRTNEQASGIMHFAYMTWLRQCYDYKNISPYPTYYAMQRAMQPILVSAELWGRNLYAGSKLATRIYLVNDHEQGRALTATDLEWQIVDENNNVLASGTDKFPAVPYYGRTYITPNITMPAQLKNEIMPVKLKLAVKENGKVISTNWYDLNVARKEYATAHVIDGKHIALLDNDGMAKQLDAMNIPYQKVTTVKELTAKKLKADLIIISGRNRCTPDEAKALTDYQANGGKVLYLNSNEVAKAVYPDYIKSWVTPTEGDIVVMERNDASVFNGIDVLNLRYFNNNQREMPKACNTTMDVVRHANITELATQMKIHAYLDENNMEARAERLEKLRGLTLFQVSEGKGKAIVSTMSTQKADTDPIAGRLLVNIINDLL